MVLIVALDLKAKRQLSKLHQLPSFACLWVRRTSILGKTHPPSLQFAQDSTKSEISNFLAAQEALFGDWLSNDSGLLIKGMKW